MEASGHALTGLLLTYPVHQACDILFCKANVVPIGKDNLPHVEITRTIARRFNERYAKKNRCSRSRPPFCLRHRRFRVSTAAR